MGDEHDDGDGPEGFRAYVEAKQRNVDWPDAMRNSATVDALLWKGSPHLTKIQRIGLAVFGIFFLVASGGLALTAWEQHSGLALLPVGFGLFISARLIRNACRRNFPSSKDDLSWFHNFYGKNRSAPPRVRAQYADMATIQMVPTTAKVVEMNAAFDADRAWRQVQTRTVSADGQFVYAVETTGIFCRPSCPSRRPARQNVRFFANADAAMAAGYRACRRCHPAGEHAEAETVRRLCDYLDRHVDRVVTLQELGRLTAMSPFTVQRMFERVLGVSPRHYQIDRRSALLRDRLADGSSVTDAIYEAGFSSSSRMYEGADARLGMRPERFRKGGLGERIRFVVTNCPLGKMLVAATARGLCAVTLGDDAAAMEKELRERFTAADIQAATMDDELLGTTARAVISRMTEHPVALDLPLDLRATAFEQRVWRLLQSIPRGETRSYSAVAAELGQPRAVRAVARACARNPLALVVPCHRVVGKNGQLTGYRWGKERKEELLALEHANTGEESAASSHSGGKLA